MVKNGSLFWDLTSKMMDLNMILSIFNMELYLEIMVQWIGLREILHQTHGTWNPPMFFLEKTWFPVNIFPLTNVLTIVMFGFPDWWAVWHVLYTHIYIYICGNLRNQNWNETAMYEETYRIQSETTNNLGRNPLSCGLLKL